MDTKPFNWSERRYLAEAWQSGCPVFGLRLSKIRPHFSVKVYAAAVQVAREETSDDADYSQETDE